MSEGKKVEFEHCRDVAQRFQAEGAGHYAGCSGIRETYTKCDMGCDEYRSYEQIRDLIAGQRRERWNQALDAAIVEVLKGDLLETTGSRVAKRIRALKDQS